MLHASTQKLIIKICELTDAGAIAWKEGKGETPSSVFDSEGYAVEVVGDPPMIRVLNTAGREIERVDAEDLASTAWPGGDGTFATHLVATAARAHRIARGAETAISRILSSLSAPPQRTPEPEPTPAAPEFDMAPLPRPAPPAVRAAESEAAMAAIAADMETLRRSASPQPPPRSHSTPVAPPDRLPAAAPQIPSLSALMRSTTTPKIETEPPPTEPSSRPAAKAASPEPAREQPAVAPAAAPAPQPILAAPPLAPSPPNASRPGIGAERPPQPPPQPAFGALPSFSTRTQAPGSQPAAAAQLAPTKVTSGGLVLAGLSAVTRQTIRGEPVPEPPKPAPSPPPKVEPPAPSGADIYKPWV